MAMFYCFLLTMTVLATSNAAPNQGADEVLKIPAECEGQQFCSIKPEGYENLEEKINSLLSGLFLEDGFNDRIGEENSLKPPTISPKEDWHNCPYKTKTEPFYTYRHENTTKTDIIVQTKLFRQYVDVVTCATEHIDTTSSQQCFEDPGRSEFGMKTSCVNSVATRTLYVFDVANNKIIQKPYNVPACCRCEVSDEYAPLKD